MPRVHAAHMTSPDHFLETHLTPQAHRPLALHKPTPLCGGAPKPLLCPAPANPSFDCWATDPNPTAPCDALLKAVPVAILPKLRPPPPPKAEPAADGAKPPPPPRDDGLPNAAGVAAAPNAGPPVAPCPNALAWPNAGVVVPPWPRALATPNAEV